MFTVFTSLRARLIWHYIIATMPSINLKGKADYYSLASLCIRQYFSNRKNVKEINNLILKFTDLWISLRLSINYLNIVSMCFMMYWFTVYNWSLLLRSLSVFIHWFVTAPFIYLLFNHPELFQLYNNNHNDTLYQYPTKEIRRMK